MMSSYCCLKQNECLFHTHGMKAESMTIILCRYVFHTLVFTVYACLQGYAFPLITMSFMRHMRLKCARYNCMVILCLKCVCMHIMYWSCSWLVMCQADYDIKGYAFPLITIAFMRIAKVCMLLLCVPTPFWFRSVCACMLCIGTAHLPREHTSLTTMTSMDMRFPGLFYHVLYVDSHSCTLLCTYCTFLTGVFPGHYV